MNQLVWFEAKYAGGTNTGKRTVDNQVWLVEIAALLSYQLNYITLV